MGLAGGDVLAGEVPVEIDGGVDLLHDGIGAVREAAAPHLVAHVTPFGRARPVASPRICCRCPTSRTFRPTARAGAGGWPRLCCWRPQARSWGRYTGSGAPYAIRMRRPAVSPS